MSKYTVSGTATYQFTVELEATSADAAFDAVDGHPVFTVDGLQLTDMTINDVKKGSV